MPGALSGVGRFFRLRWARPSLALLIVFAVTGLVSPVSAASPTRQPTAPATTLAGTRHAITAVRRLAPFNVTPPSSPSPAPQPAPAIPYYYDTQSPIYPYIPRHGATALPPPSGVQPSTSVNVSFQGQGPIGGYYAGDPSVALGPTDLAQTVNEEIAFYDMAGNREGYAGFQSWLGVDPNTRIVDGHLLYCVANGGHFILFLLDHTDNYVDMVTSQGNDAYTSGWCVYRLLPDSGYAADFPEVGLNSDLSGPSLGLYLTLNLINSGGEHAVVYAIDRVAAESCAGIAADTEWPNVPNADGTTAFTIAPAITRQGTSQDEWPVDSSSTGGCALNDFKLDSTPTLYYPTSVGTICYARPSNAGAAQQGMTATLGLGTAGSCRPLTTAPSRPRSPAATTGAAATSTPL